MDKSFGLDDPAPVLGYKVGRVFDWQHHLTSLVDKPLGFRGHLPIGLGVVKLGEYLVLTFFVGKT